MGKPNYTIESIIKECKKEKSGIEKEIYEYLNCIKHNNKLLYENLAIEIKNQDFDDIAEIAIYLGVL